MNKEKEEERVQIREGEREKAGVESWGCCHGVWYCGYKMDCCQGDRQLKATFFYIPIKSYPLLPQIILKNMSVWNRTDRTDSLKCWMETTVSEGVQKIKAKPFCPWPIMLTCLVSGVMSGLFDPTYSTRLSVKNRFSMQIMFDSVLTSSMERFFFFFLPPARSSARPSNSVNHSSGIRD